VGGEGRRIGPRRRGRAEAAIRAFWRGTFGKGNLNRRKGLKSWVEIGGKGVSPKRFGRKDRRGEKVFVDGGSS